MNDERWLPVVGYEGIYEVSDHGRVRSVDHTDTYGRRRRGKILNQSQTTNGRYLCVDLYRGGKSTRRMMRVHRLVAQAFLGEPPTPEHTDCCHIDGDGTNNTPTNLRWDTHAENLRDRVAHGTHPETSKTHCPEGHALVEGNLVQHPWRTKGHRVCLKCRRARDARRRAGAG